MAQHSFGSKFLQEISITVILIFCSNFPVSKYSLLLLSIFNLFAIEKLWLKSSLMKKIELMKSVNTLITNLIKHDWARVRKIYYVLYHTAASIKVYRVTYAL